MVRGQKNLWYNTQHNNNTTTRPWTLLPPLARSERCRSTPGRITAPIAYRTPPPTLRREGNHDHGPAPGKLQGRRCILRQPKSAIPTATYRRRHHHEARGPPSHTRRAPSLRGSHYLMPPLAIIQPFPGTAAGLRPRGLQLYPSANGISHRLQHLPIMEIILTSP